MDRIIEIKVNGSHLTKDNRIAGVQHEGNAKTLRIEFDEGWDGYAKKVTFWDATGANPVERTLTADLLEDITESIRIYLCKIPPEPMAEAGEFTFVIDGYTDGVRQRSISDTMVVKPAPFIEKADEPTDPTPSQAEQLQVQIDTLLGDIQKEAIRAEDAADRAEDAQEGAEAAKEGAEAAKEAAEKAADESEKAQAAIENMTVSSETLAPGSEASVKKTEKNGVVNLHFGIPKGVKGDPGSGGGSGGGTGDMSVSTYDPTGKKQDVFAYADKAASSAATQAAKEAAEQAAAEVAEDVETVAAEAAAAAAKTAAEQAVANADVKKHASRHAKNGADPIAPADIGAAPDDHTHTAADVGAVPTTGGTMTGDLTIEKSVYPKVDLKNTTSGRRTILIADDDGKLRVANQTDGNNYSCIVIRPETGDLTSMIALSGMKSGTWFSHNILHTGSVTAGTTDLTAGTTALATGAQYLVYE